jgi:hypothetical protein
VITFLTVAGVIWLVVAVILMAVSVLFPFGPAAERSQLDAMSIVYFGLWPITFAYGIVKISRMNRT